MLPTVGQALIRPNPGTGRQEEKWLGLSPRCVPICSRFFPHNGGFLVGEEKRIKQ